MLEATAPQPSVPRRLTGKTRSLGRWSSHPEDPAVPAAPPVGGDTDIRKTLIWNHCVRMHRMIPKDVLITWISNMRSYVQALANIEGDGNIVLGCSCSGTGIWSNIFNLLLVFGDEEFGLRAPVYPMA